MDRPGQAAVSPKTCNPTYPPTQTNQKPTNQQPNTTQDVPPLIAASKYYLVNIYREELFLVRAHFGI